jgi:hypothetical protein
MRSAPHAHAQPAPQEGATTLSATPGCTHAANSVHAAHAVQFAAYLRARIRAAGGGAFSFSVYVYT